MEYFYNDRGRGPEIRGHYRFDPPTVIDLAGHDYYKAPVDEHFTMADGEARWKSTSEQGPAAGQSVLHYGEWCSVGAGIARPGIRDRTFHRLMAAARNGKAEDRPAREVLAQDNLYPRIAALSGRALPERKV